MIVAMLLCGCKKSSAISSCTCINDAFCADGAAEVRTGLHGDRNQGCAGSCAAAVASYFRQK